MRKKNTENLPSSKAQQENFILKMPKLQKKKKTQFYDKIYTILIYYINLNKSEIYFQYCEIS